MNDNNEDKLYSDKTYHFCLKLLNDYTDSIISLATNKKIPKVLDRQRKDIVKYMVAGRELIERLEA